VGKGVRRAVIRTRGRKWRPRVFYRPYVYNRIFGA